MGVYKKQWAETIQDGAVNDAIAAYHAKRPQREQDCATPSTLTDCPRVVWLRYKKKVAPKFPLKWGKAQRMLHGRVFEDTIAEQLRESGNLLYHWKDGENDQSVKFEMGEGNTRICGTPDLLLKINGKVYISDAKTSMGKSFGYVPLTAEEAFEDYFWYKYKLQVTAYYLLALKNKDWFSYTAEEKAKVDAMYEPSARYVLKDAKKDLPLPEACHLFSYALDDGVVRREFTWTPTKADAEEVLRYTKRWNEAFNSETIPDCTCSEFDGAPTKFCYYTTEQETTKTGAKIGVRCCDSNLNKEG